MVVFNTQMHITTFLICLLELVFLFYQSVYYLSRPSDKKRKWYLILLFLLIQKNIISGLLPDSNLSMNIIAQSVLSYGSSLAIALYIPYYFYKSYELTKLKFHAYWGPLLFLLLPYFCCFVIPYSVTGNLQASVRLYMVIPFFYAITFLYYLARAIKAKNIENPDDEYRKELRGAFMGIVFFVLLPVMAFFKNELDSMLVPLLHFNDGSQVVELFITNLSLLVFTISFIRSTVKQSKAEYEKLLKSEKELLELNSKLLAKVKERTQELELVNEQRTHAFINLAHETKTPLMLITNYLDEYIRKYGQPENEELKLLKKAIGNLTKDIVNFFDIEKIQKGMNMYNHHHISSLSEILTESVKLFKVFAAKKEMEIVADISDTIFIKADPSSLFRIINNLMENAIKYTPNGGKIEVTLKVIDNKVNFSVKDNGIGIPPASQTRIFEPYYQINSEKANFQGMGLGLSIVKKILVDLNGEIKILSDPSTAKGTTVVVELPLYKKSKDELIMEFSDDTSIYFEVEKLVIAEQPFDESKYTILIVEDNIPLLTYMVEMLQHKFNVHFAVNGEECIEKLKGINQLDLIVSDVMMDNGDGYFLYQHLQKSKQFGHVPFIFLTAKNTADARMEGLSLGAVDYICKPVSVPELEIKINSLLKNILNQKNAIITNVYHSMTNNKAPQNTTISEVSLSAFESNCVKYNLTRREVAVIHLMAEGKITKEIAAVLFISIDTVKKHIQNGYYKVGVNSKFELLKKLECVIQ
jgi:signal transduction histidine kinase/DNA-binding NarL/FixJ family response regulator